MQLATCLSAQRIQVQDCKELKLLLPQFPLLHKQGHATHFLRRLEDTLQLEFAYSGMCEGETQGGGLSLSIATKCLPY